ncbi:glucosamine-6-phosphate deaminase [Flaviflexus huanghaiensis]|uniref:glucosamine-6-phosphate deaminase n=1 Tax=Flaviflexus huanghaiensis TaxID=1111473 RepID=UPI0015F8405C|nr:glucosamine-6-phosphate deaminase [Flaviflexus huanghaiensis]
MRVIIRDTADEASRLAAQQIIDGFTPPGRLGVATGSTPLPVYRYLREAYARGEFTLHGSTAWALDEYVGIDEEHPERYRNVLLHELVGNGGTGLAADDLKTPDGKAEDPVKAARIYDELIGPGVDIQILGLGSNGHIGFNEPFDSLTSRTHVGLLTGTTRQDNARFFDGDIEQVPEYCVTQGLATIMTAKSVVLLAFGERKAEPVAHIVEGAVSQRWPGSILQLHDDVTVYLDESAASQLEFIDSFKKFHS